MDHATSRNRDVGDDRVAESDRLQTNLHLPAETADATVRDLEAPMRRKPASNDVDASRAAQARATEADR